MDNNISTIMNCIYCSSVQLIRALWCKMTNSYDDISDPVHLISQLISSSSIKERKILLNVKEVRNKAAHMGIITSYNIRMLKLLSDIVDIDELIYNCQIIVDWISSQRLLPVGTQIQIDNEFGYISNYTLNGGKIGFVVITAKGTEIHCDEQTTFSIIS